ncbi:MAG: hypothetical protein J0H83_17245 [Candidatus Melainabacteria bacterium]|nr:hypothetical protein [Candidatus Melainabacteria bacterium]
MNPKKILLAVLIAPVVSILVFLGLVLTYPTYGEFVVLNNSDEDLSRVTLLVDKRSFEIDDLPKNGKQKVRFKIGSESSLAIKAITKSGKLISGENLVYVDGAFDTSATICIRSSSIEVQNLKLRAWWRPQK